MTQNDIKDSESHHLLPPRICSLHLQTPKHPFTNSIYYLPTAIMRFTAVALVGALMSSAVSGLAIAGKY